MRDQRCHGAALQPGAERHTPSRSTLTGADARGANARSDIGSLLGSEARSAERCTPPSDDHSGVMAGSLLSVGSRMRRNESLDVIAAAEAHFEKGAEVVYVSVEEDGTILVTAHPPNRQVFVAARSTAQVERFVEELHR